MKDWIDELIPQTRNYFRDGKGVVILKDAKFISTDSDPRTFIAEFVIKESEAVQDDVTPNPAGSTVSVVHKWTMHKPAKTNSKELMEQVIKTVKPDFVEMAPAAQRAAFAEVLRYDGDYTDTTKPCPARGIELAYETRRQWNKDRTKELVLIDFEARQISKEQLQANRNAIDGKA